MARREALSLRGPSSSTRKNVAPLNLCRRAAVLPVCNIAQINWRRLGWLSHSGWHTSRPPRKIRFATFFGPSRRVDFTARYARGLLAVRECAATEHRPDGRRADRGRLRLKRPHMRRDSRILDGGLLTVCAGRPGGVAATYEPRDQRRGKTARSRTERRRR
jgi:hypothetical protein